MGTPLLLVGAPLLLVGPPLLLVGQTPTNWFPCRLQQSNYQDLVPREAFPEGGIGNVERCLSDWQDDKETKRMVESLKIFAITGFVPMKGEDNIGRILTRNNVAGFVSPTSSTYGINKAFNGGMVPSTQTCRLDIVRVLSYENLI